MLPKSDELSSVLFDCSSDGLALTETWLDPKITDSELLPNHTDVLSYGFDRADRREGGALLGVKKYLSSSPLDGPFTCDLWGSLSAPELS